MAGLADLTIRGYTTAKDTAGVVASMKALGVNTPKYARDLKAILGIQKEIADTELAIAMIDDPKTVLTEKKTALEAAQKDVLAEADVWIDKLASNPSRTTEECEALAAEIVKSKAKAMRMIIDDIYKVNIGGEALKEIGAESANLVKARRAEAGLRAARE